jgi:hypothetical protein
VLRSNDLEWYEPAEVGDPFGGSGDGAGGGAFLGTTTTVDTLGSRHGRTPT